jgi:hypothetical protein
MDESPGFNKDHINQRVNKTYQPGSGFQFRFSVQVSASATDIENQELFDFSNS